MWGNPGLRQGDFPVMGGCSHKPWIDVKFWRQNTSGPARLTRMKPPCLWLAIACGWLIAGPGALAQEVTLPAVEIRNLAATPPPIKGPDGPAKPMESSPPTLEKAINADAMLNHLGIALTDDQRQYLTEHRILLLTLDGTKLDNAYDPGPPPKYRAYNDEMLSAFERIGSDETGQAKLITPDLAMHAYHRFFSHALEGIEQHQLRPRLERFLYAALYTALNNAAGLRETAPEAAQHRLDVIGAQFAAAWCVLGRETESGKPSDRTAAQRLEAAVTWFPKPVAARLRADVEQILAAENRGGKGLFAAYDAEKVPGYTHFRPRSHYTKSEELKGYFRAMMYLGSNGYGLDAVQEPPTLGLTDSLLLSLVLSTPDASGWRPLDGWCELMEITGFFAGQSDAITYIEFRAWLAATLRRDRFTPADALDEATLSKLQDAVSALRRPRILSDERDRNQRSKKPPIEFRILGQRFSFDAWVLTRFTAEIRSDSSAADSSLFPTGALIPAAFGDAAAEEYSISFVNEQPSAGEDRIAKFTQTLGELRKAYAGTPDEVWFGSMAGQQLHALSQLAGPRGENYPHFMRSPGFAAKNLESMLGHWTESKHDTVLYTQPSAPPAPAPSPGMLEFTPPKSAGFVQPDLKFWREMERLAAFTKAGFESRNLLPDMDGEWSPLSRFVKDMTLCRKLAEKEARGEPLSRDDYEAIGKFSLLYMDFPLGYRQAADGEYGKCALITDVHTDPYRHEVLQEALGRPCILLALLGTGNTPRLAAGMAYQHFEFRGPQAPRATDEEWRAKVYVPEPDLPPRATWAAPIFGSNAAE